MTKRLVSAAAGFLAAAFFLCGQANAISAQKAILMDASTGRVIYECRADERGVCFGGETN